MEMTPEEMNRAYRLSAHPKKQIKILAECNQITQDKVREILRSTGLSIGQTKKVRRTRWTEAMLDKLRELYYGGVPHEEIAACMGLSVSVVNNKIVYEGLRQGKSPASVGADTEPK